MTRRDVPYPGGRCSLKCELENLWRELRAKLKSINGVPGDGAGDVKLKAGANVTITNDAAHNEITISAEDAVGIAKINNTNPDSGGNFGISGDSHITVTAQTNGMQIGTTGLATSAELGDVIDGTTPVQKATDADHQTSADSATNADHQTTADSQTTAASATNADHQTSADSQTSAGSATTATTATTAGSQTSAGEAAKLSTARSIKTNLGSTAAASFDGSSDINPGVDGILPIANGGTGSATKNFVDYSSPNQIITAQITTSRTEPQVIYKNPNYEYSSTPAASYSIYRTAIRDMNDTTFGEDLIRKYDTGNIRWSKILHLNNNSLGFTYLQVEPNDIVYFKISKVVNGVTTTTTIASI